MTATSARVQSRAPTCQRACWPGPRRGASRSLSNAKRCAGGYHYYPGRDQAAGWLRQAGLGIVDEGFKQEEGWGYRHFLLRPARDAAAAAPG
ncbi:MAG TPA: hypothetical protein VLW44_12740 [Streptosporangiaceae bacterium]|nr:hypothetical protein [Streptosporangiaceae bacterium]